MSIFLEILTRIGFAKIGLVFLGLIVTYFYINNSILESDLEKAQKDLQVAINANIANEKTIKRLQKQREQDLLSLQEIEQKKFALEKTLNEVKDFIDENNSETNTTKLFNAVLDKLWKNSTTSCGKN